MEKRVPESVLGREIRIEEEVEEAPIFGKDVSIQDDSYMYVFYFYQTFVFSNF